MELDIILPIFTAIGISITYAEWDNLVEVYKENPRLFYVRLFMLNLPLVVMINLLFMGDL